MSNFKHSMNLSGSSSSFDRFEKELQGIGYKEYTSDKGNTLVVNVFSKTISNPNGTYRRTSNPQPRDYEFNIDNENEYKIALAIAAIKGEDNKCNKGEIWQYENINRLYIIDDTTKNGHIITSLSGEGIKKSVYNHNIPGQRWKKLTPEEIMKFFNHAKENKMKEGKKIIGYMAPFDLFEGGIKAGSIFKPLTSATYKTDEFGPTQYSKHLPKEIVEKWEAVYEEEKISIGKYTAEFIERGSVKFGCQKFSRSEVAFLIHLIETDGVQASISIQGTKITKELLDNVFKQIK